VRVGFCVSADVTLLVSSVLSALGLLVGLSVTVLRPERLALSDTPAFPRGPPASSLRFTSPISVDSLPAIFVVAVGVPVGAVKRMGRAVSAVSVVGDSATVVSVGLRVADRLLASFVSEVGWGSAVVTVTGLGAADTLEGGMADCIAETVDCISESADCTS
jgi:hypothetical protein